MGTTPIYGFPYPDPSDLVANYPALGQQLAEDIESVLPTIGGLAPATPTTIANSGGTATLTDNTVTFTGVTSVSLNGVFSTTYTNYVVKIRAIGSAANATMTLKERAAGADNSANYTTQQITANNTTVAASRVTGQTSFEIAGVRSGDSSSMTLDMYSPFVNTTTQFTEMVFDGNSTFRAHVGTHAAASYDGFTLIIDSGSITGTVAVYGYRK